MSHQFRRHPRLALFATTLLVCAFARGAEEGWLDRLKGAVEGPDSAAQSLSTDEIAAGLKEALAVGTGNVVDRLGTADGFNLDPNVHIPLPDELDQAREWLSKVGMEASLDDLETRLNGAAELATPRARALFMGAIRDMTLEDVRAIYDGPPDAATQYFRGRMEVPLSEDMKPIVEEALADSGAAQVYATAMDRYRQIPLAPPVDADLADHVVARGTDGIFYYLAEEEAAIRANPAKRTTELLKRVFGGLGRD